VQQNSKQIQNKWNKMKKIYELKKKLTTTTDAPPLDWPLRIFFNIAKINGMPITTKSKCECDEF
jgi:hypothetical protein